MDKTEGLPYTDEDAVCLSATRAFDIHYGPLFHYRQEKYLPGFSGSLEL